MADGEEADREDQERQNNAGTPLPPAIARPAPDPEKPHSEEVYKRPGSNPQETGNWFGKPDWWMVILTLLLFVVGAITLRVFYKQFGEMQKQTGILNTQAQQAATDSVESAKKVGTQ